MASRIHGDVYVRFRGRYAETCRRKAVRRCIPSLQTNLREARPELYEKLCERNNLKRPASLDDEKMAFAPLDEMIEKKLWVCPISLEHQDSAYYSIAKDAIVLPEKSQFINGESFYGTLLHEMTHSTGAEGRLDRIKPAAFGSKEYAREELVAELDSALVASQYGITKTIKEDSAQYLGSWLDVLKESPEFLKTTLFDVKKASSMIAQRIDAVAEKIEAKERMFYSSVAYLQFSDDTGQFDELKEKGDYEGLLALGREYYDGNGINEKYTYLSPLQNKGDDLLIEDKDFAVVYNGSVGGTYEVMLKFTEQEIRDHIKQYGVDIAGETIKEVARDMVAEQFDRLPRSPVLEMASGDILYLEYNREKDCLAVGTVTNAGLAVQHSFAYNHNQDLDDNLQDVQTALEAYPEYQYRGDAAEERVNPQIDLMDADNDGNTQEVAHEEREQEDEHVPYRRGR